MRLIPQRFLAALITLGATMSACVDEPDAAFTTLIPASLFDAFVAVEDAYFEETGVHVSLSSSASSEAARQVILGAPANIVVLANTALMDDLEARGLIDAATRREPLTTSLVLVAPADSPLSEVEIGPGLDLGALLGPDGRLSVGDPAHVPAGIYARAALESLGLWETAEPRLAPGANVRGALALVERGEAPLGIVYATDAVVTERVKVIGVFPRSSHPPIAYSFAILADKHTPETDDFFAFATGETGLEIFEDFGFERR
ncbi:MAG: molybdate ABC transporter substrate-binding protein [Maricaulaceae bacterium]|jgi:molybdate transport system substrate-binding protein